MSNTERRKILNYRSASGISPNPDNIDYGEIAIGYKKDNEAIYIKNTTNEIVDFTPISIVNLTYNELKNLRDNSKLKPSQYYRITDFVTTVANDPEARSAGHPFDLIVLALDKNKLHEECHAIHHEGDTYFADCNLAAWKIWYCLDNDKSRFAWADDTYKLNPSSIICDCYKYETKVDVPIDYSEKQFVNGTIYYRDEENDTIFPFMNNNPAYAWTSKNNITIFTTTISPESLTLAYAYNTSGGLAIVADSGDMAYRTTSYVEGLPNYDFPNGRGVIYRMIDEWGNDCPYDFKNVQFKRYWANGINIAKKEGEPKDIILQGYYGTVSNTDIFTEGIDTEDCLFCFTFTRLNNILANYEKGSVIQSNVLDESIQTEGLDTDAEDDKLNNPIAYHFHNRCRNNILKPTETGLVVDTKEYMTFILLNNVFITVKDDENKAYYPSFDNTLGSSCVNNTFGSNIYGLIFLSCCSNNTFGNDCYDISFGTNCGKNVFGDYCNSNSFGDYCNSNSFGFGCSNNSLNHCSANSFGNDCSANSFGFGCPNNSFGNNCVDNSFGFGCQGNSFGNNCYDNSFGNDCNYISFMNNCKYNSFGNECSGNSFGNECSANSFGNNCYDNSFGNYFKYNALGNDAHYILIPTDKIYHTQILNGTKGDSKPDKLTIAFTPETTYSQFAGFTSDGVLKIWVEADDPHDGIDCGNY